MRLARWLLGLVIVCSTAALGCSDDEDRGASAGSGGTVSGGGSGASPAGGGSGGSVSGGGSGGTAATGGGGSSGAGGGGSGGTGGVPPTPPAYDLHANDRLTCKFGKGTLTTETIGPSVPHGDALPFEHVVVLMQENRSFDHYFLKLPEYGVTDVDVATEQHFNVDPTTNEKVYMFHETRMCVVDVAHDWEPVHQQWNLGKMDGFVSTNNPGGARAMGYYDQNDFPFYYWMAKTFSISDRFFSSALGPTWPNRFFFYGGTAWGNTKTESVDPVADPAYKTEPKITDLVKTAGKTFKVYRYGLASFMLIFGLTAENLGVQYSQFKLDVQNDALPSLVLIDPSFSGSSQNDEHPPSNPQFGQQFVKDVYDTLTSNPAVWKKTVFFVIYDEHGGFYDHVPPPQACQPDNYAPYKYDFGRLGIRMPVLVASPYVKAGYVSHFVTDLTSVTRFIENRFDLPALTDRDANAWPMLDMFDFQNPPFMTPPAGAPAAVVDPAKQQWCLTNPPGTGMP